MPAQTLRDAYKAWGDWVNHILRKPTDAEIAALMPVDHPIPVDQMTVGEVLDFQENLWKAKQVREVIGVIRKEVAYARRNEHHQITSLFTKEEIAAISPETMAKLKARFGELNETVKGNF